MTTQRSGRKTKAPNVSFPLWAHLLLWMRNERTNVYVERISHALYSTYSHTSRLMMELEARGLVIGNMEGRTRQYLLTPKGIDTAASLAHILKLEPSLYERTMNGSRGTVR